MRIAFFVDQFPSLSETFILNQITGLIDRGYEVDIYCDRRGNVSQVHPEVEEYKLLKRTYYNPIPRNIIFRFLQGLVLLILYFPQAPQTILNVLKVNNKSSYGDLGDFLKPLYLTLPLLHKQPYDIIHCHYGRNGLKAILLKDLEVINGKIVVTFHGNDMSRYLQIHGKDVYDYLFKKADLLQPISQHWAQKLITLGCSPQKIMVHHMGIDGTKFVPKENNKSTAKEILIVSIARLVEKKGLSYGIKAVAQLLHNQPQLNLQYHIIGDGVLRKQLQTEIKTLGMREVIKLLGWKNQQEVTTIIDRADIILAPSVTSTTGDCEGIPVSLMEAMAQGIPVISTYHSGIPELIEDGVTGYLVSERNTEDLTRKLATLIKDSSLREKMGAAGREKVMKEFNIDCLNDLLSNTYQQMIGTRAK